MRSRTAVVLLFPLCSILSVACCPTTSGPTGPTATFTGTIAGAVPGVHDFMNPPGTSQMEVVVTWSDPDVDLRVSWVDSSCDPTTRDDCRRFSDPIGPLPGTSRIIRTIATNQGPAAGPRMRFVITRTTPGPDAAYSLTVAPHQAGCT
jgi:hypothetical protein